MIESVRHRLAAAFRFVDIFTGKPVDMPLDVRVETFPLPFVKGSPNLPWRAVPGPNDDTYRFFVTNNAVMPASPSPIPVTVSMPANVAKEAYVSFESVEVTLPLPLAAHPPTPARSDFLIEKTLWPTRAVKVPAGETAVVATVKSAGATPIGRLRVKLWAGLGPPPVSPYAYTDASGEFLFRLAELKTVVGGVISTTAMVNIEIRVPPTYATAVVPTQIRTDAGAVLPLPFPLRIGQVTTLEISIP